MEVQYSTIHTLKGGLQGDGVGDGGEEGQEEEEEGDGPPPPHHPAGPGVPHINTSADMRRDSTESPLVPEELPSLLGSTTSL